MSDKPRDILEFLRRAGREPSTAVVDPLPGIPVVETPVTKGDFSAWMLVKRQQVWIAGVAAGLFAVLTLLIGYAWGSPAATEAPAASGVVVHTIQAIAYDATPNGEVRAKSVAAQLRRVVDEEVTVQRLDRHRKILVTVGSWLSNPLANERARALLKQIRALEVDGRDRHPFQSALFYRLER